MWIGIALIGAGIVVTAAALLKIFVAMMRARPLGA